MDKDFLFSASNQSENINGSFITAGNGKVLSKWYLKSKHTSLFAEIASTLTVEAWFNKTSQTAKLSSKLHLSFAYWTNLYLSNHFLQSLKFH